MRVSVVAKDRTMFIDDEYTIAEARDIIKQRGSELSLRKTLKLYGLKYVADRAFISRYRVEFDLYNGKSIDDIQLKELRMFRDALIGNRVQRH